MSVAPNLYSNNSFRYGSTIGLTLLACAAMALRLSDWLGLWHVIALSSVAILLVSLVADIYHRNTKNVVLTGICLALLGFIWFFLHTNHVQYTHDIRGHLAYINYIKEHSELPKPSRGWLTYHPPLYYILAAGLYRFAEILNINAKDLLRLLGISLYISFLFIGSRTMLCVLKDNSRLVYLGLIMLFLWPVGMMIAPRIENSLLYYQLAAFSFYCLLRWYQRPSQSHYLAWSIACVGLTLLVRSNGLILLPVILATCMFKLLLSHIPARTLFTKSICISLCFMLLCGSFNVMRNVVERIEEGIDRPLIVGNSKHIDRWKTYTGNKPSDFLTFDYPAYFASTTFWNKESGARNNFWVVLLKSSVTGEKRFKHIWAMDALHILILPIVLLVLLPIAFYRRKDIEILFPCLVYLFLSVAALMFNRWNTPVVTSGDFRYILPVLPAFLILLIYNLQHMKWLQRPVILSMIILMCVVFIRLGITVYLEQWVAF